MDFFTQLSAITVVLVLTTILFYHSWRSKTSGTSLPPQPTGTLPIIGHLHQLGAQKTLPRAFASIADKYGPIFTIWLGVHRAVVVSDSELIKECFTKNDRVLASRPKSSHGKYLSYNYAAFGFASSGTYWRDIRKIVLVQLLSGQRLKSLRHVQVSEVSTLIKDLYVLCETNRHGFTKVIMNEWLERLTLNMITRMIAGKRYFKNGDSEDEEGKRIGKLMKEYMYISGVFVPSDLVPFLGLLNYFPGPVRNMKRLSRELDSLMGSWIEEHKLHGVKSVESDHGAEDFIDIMLSVLDDEFQGHSREDIIKGTAMTLIIAGADTTSVALTWIISNLLNNKRTLEVAKQEIDLKIGKQRWVEESDIKNLVYLQAVVKETLRLYPPGPLAVPHEATEDCTISGYHIPRGTRVFANLWKLHRDPNVWSSPDEFRPERFLKEHENTDVLGQCFELIPFGSGRRSCPGSMFALQVLHLTLARLIQGFDFNTPGNGPIDMGEGQSITLPKATPLEVEVVPRLSPQLYYL